MLPSRNGREAHLQVLQISQEHIVNTISSPELTLKLPDTVVAIGARSVKEILRMLPQ